MLDLTQEGRQPEGAFLDGDLAGLDPGEVQDVVDDEQQGAAGGVDLLHQAVLVGVQAGPRQDLGHAEHGIHGGADLVAHVGQEEALGFVGGLGGLLGGPQFLLQFALRRDVAVDAHDAQGLALVVPLFDDRDRMDVADPTAGQDDAEDILVGDLVAQGLLHLGHGVRQVVGVQAGPPEVVGDALVLDLPGHLIPGPQALVPLQFAAGDIPVPDANVGGLGGQGEAIHGLGDLAPGAHPFGDVADDADGVPAILEGDPGQGEFDGDLLAVLAPGGQGDGFADGRPLAAAQELGEGGVMSRIVGPGGQQAVQVLAEGLLGVVAQDDAGGGVPVGDLAPGIHHEDGVVGRVGDAAQPVLRPALGVQALLDQGHEEAQGGEDGQRQSLGQAGEGKGLPGFHEKPFDQHQGEEGGQDASDQASEPAADEDRRVKKEPDGGVDHGAEVNLQRQGQEGHQEGQQHPQVTTKPQRWRGEDQWLHLELRPVS